MEHTVRAIKVEGEGLEALIGKRVLVMCVGYFYHGTLVSVNSEFLKLDDCAIVYETGAWSDKAFKDAQLIGDGHYVMTQAIESLREDNRR